jgi:hypothetical protein
MKRRKIRKTKPAIRRTKRKALRKGGARPAAPEDSIDALIASSVKVLGLALEPSWHAAVKFNVALILRHATLVEAFPLPDDAEPAPVFHA